MAQLLLYVVIAAVVVWRVVFRQLRGSMITVSGMVVMPGILLVVGLENCVGVLPAASGAEIAWFGADLAALVVLGFGRAASTRVGTRDGFAFQKGTSLTLILWLVTVAVRIGLAVLGHSAGSSLTSASMALSLGLSIGVQNLLIYTRARRAGLRIATRRSDVVAARR